MRRGLHIGMAAGCLVLAFAGPTDALPAWLVAAFAYTRLAVD